MLFLGIISWRGASRFDRGVGFVFQMGGWGVEVGRTSFLKGGGAQWESISFDDGLFEKIVGWGRRPPLRETLRGFEISWGYIETI